MSDSVTVAAPPDTSTVAASLLAYISGQSGVVTDFNKGSQVRTLSEAVGQISELEGIAAQALAFQTIIYGCWAAFGIVPLTAQAATGVVTFVTATSGTPPPASQAVLIPAGTIVQTTGGTQFQTTQDVTLAVGATSVSVPVVAVTAGAAGNCPQGAINTIVSAIPYPLYVTNGALIANGSDAETPAATMLRFTAKVMSLPASTPVAIANACIGVTAPGSSEQVLYSTVYEPWIEQAQGSQTAGYQVYIDNGSGTASSGLVAAVAALLPGNRAAGLIGYADAGVPRSVAAVTPVNWSVVVTATLLDSTTAAANTASVQTAVQAYAASLQFGASPAASQINTAVGNALAGFTSSYSVALLDGSGTAQQTITVPPTQRALLTTVTSNLS